MSRATLIACALLLAASTAFAATPDELWQDYQKKPDIVSTTPTKPAERETPKITVEAQDGMINTPTTPAEAKAKAELHTQEAQDADAGTETEALDTNDVPAAESKKPADKTVNTETASDKAVPADKTSTPVVSNKPTADPAKQKPKPLLNLVGKPPLPRQFMRTPQVGDFTTTTSVSGGYTIALPRAFGENPLVALPQAEGAMLVRTASDTLMCAVTMLDPSDSTSFNATQSLPQYANAKTYWTWQQNAALTWNCKLSSHNDYHGDKMLLEAEAQQDGKTYQMLFVMPKARYTELLPQAVYALNSFQLN